MRASLIEAELRAADSVARGQINIIVNQIDGEDEDETEVGGICRILWTAMY